MSIPDVETPPHELNLYFKLITNMHQSQAGRESINELRLLITLSKLKSRVD